MTEYQNKQNSNQARTGINIDLTYETLEMLIKIHEYEHKSINHTFEQIVFEYYYKIVNPVINE